MISSIDLFLSRDCAEGAGPAVDVPRPAPRFAGVSDASDVAGCGALALAGCPWLPKMLDFGDPAGNGCCPSMVLLVGAVAGGRVALLGGSVRKSPLEAAAVLGAEGPEVPVVALRPKSTDEVVEFVIFVGPAWAVAIEGKREGVETPGETVWEDMPNNGLPEDAWLPS